MAATVYLQVRSKHRTFRNPRSIQFFSSSSSSSSSDSGDDDQKKTNNSSPSESQPANFSSYFSDVKASLKQQSQQHPQQQWQPRKPFSPSSQPPNPSTSKIASLEEIRKNLSEFRRRTEAPPAAQHVSFQELYKRNVTPTAEDSYAEANKGANLSFNAIRESLRQLRSTAATKNQVDGGSNVSPSMSLLKLKETLNLRPADPNERVSPFVIGGMANLPESVFGKEKQEKEIKTPEMETEFLKMYSYGELGEKLKMLRPEAKGEKWFSLGELNQRLKKLREFEEKQSDSSIGGVLFKDLRDSLMKLKMSDENSKKSAIQRLDVLGQLGGTPSYMMEPPKEHLVEQYFHPDNMSSSEKLKLELQKVRDEFKMSESDCGSARVQVAQLTTKIKHLSQVLHKKDKHSRKGLVDMVQRRKKLLKYLRRTDWDSYIFVLDKLELRDNPNYKTT